MLPHGFARLLQWHGVTSGCIRSVSVLVNGDSAASALASVPSSDVSVGLHLNLTEGVPLSPLAAVPSLVCDGAMLGKFGFREALASGAVDPSHVRCDATMACSRSRGGFIVMFPQIRMELQAQLSHFLRISGGTPPTHIDGHQVHSLWRVGGRRVVDSVWHRLLYPCSTSTSFLTF